MPGLFDLLERKTLEDRRGAERAMFLQSVAHCSRTCGLCGQYFGCLQYVHFLRAWHPVYETLSSALSALLGDRGGSTGLLLSELDRAPALAQDLAHLVGPDWQEEAGISPMAVRYRDRL